MPLAVGPECAVSSMGGTGAGSLARQPQPSSAENQIWDPISPTAAGGSAVSHQDTDALSTPSSAPTPSRAGEETVDRFTRHAGSGFFGNSGVAVTSCWTATTKLPPPGWERLPCRWPMRGGEWEVEDACVATYASQPNQKKAT